jgi:omega-6 fatty acid desaturase (delta-12 desaturase)
LENTNGGPSARRARDWIKVLAEYRQADHLRSITEILLTIIPFVGFWIAAWWALSISYWLTLAFAIPAGAFLVRIFLVQHDCGHGAFFSNRKANDWVGRIAGVLTLTPYAVWARSHAIHHASTGNLDKRGIGDIKTLTVSEYRQRSAAGKLAYRLYRNPLVMFVIGPAYIFLLDNRVPPKTMRGNKDYWISAMGTNLSVLVVAGLIIYFIGWGPFLLVQLPITVIAASLGVWMFYVQHQFENAFWEEDESWDLHEAALYGSSYYALPGWLSWLTGNIGVHHVHHLYSKIPFYKLARVLKDNPDLANVGRITIPESFATVKLRLWDETRQRLVSFSDAHLA